MQTCLSAPGNVFTSSVINTRVWISFSLEACGYGAEIGFYWLNLIRFWLFPEGEEGMGRGGGKRGDLQSFGHRCSREREYWTASTLRIKDQYELITRCCASILELLALSSKSQGQTPMLLIALITAMSLPNSLL